MMTENPKKQCQQDDYGQGCREVILNCRDYTGQRIICSITRNAMISYK